jgi:SAM-dependent methyltransferase
VKLMEEAAGTGGDWAERTYETYAPVYDVFTAHYDYEAWLRDLRTALAPHGLRGRRLLDVGCGTGKSFMPMLERGWEVTGCDISPSMLERARTKAGGETELHVTDMRELPVFGEFDLAWSLDDALNYLLSSDELVQTLAGMRANLAPTGLLLFDVNTLRAYRTFFAETQIIERDGHRLVWRGQASTDTLPRSLCESRLEIDPPENGVDVEACVHHQRHFPEADVLAAIESAGLECLDIYGHGYDGIFKQPLDEAVHTKAIYIARSAADAA